MRIVFATFFFSLYIQTSIAQSTDFPDYRSKRELFKRVTEPDIRSDLSSFTMGGIEESVGKLPLKRIPVSNAGPDFLEFQGENVRGDKIKVTIKGAPFVPGKHKLGYYEEKYLVKIDNKPFFGDYGKIPRTTIEQVQVIINRDTINLPQTAFSDLYNPIYTYKEGGVEKSHNSVLLSADGKKMYVYMLKRETGGSYEVAWIIQNNAYLKRMVDYGFLP